MPIYEYLCPNCGLIREKLTKLSNPSIKCYICMTDMERIMSPANFHLKGPGWAKDGYSGNKPKTGETK